MASVVGICNNALIKLGQDTIISLTEDSKAARLCNQMYVPARDAVFRAHPWNSLVRRVELAQLSTTPAYGFSYKYQLPTDCLRVLSTDKVEYDTEVFKVEGRTILSDNSTLSILYIARETDPNTYDVGLQEVIAARLAAEIAIGMTDSTTLSEQMWGRYEMKLKEARGMDGQEGTPDPIEADTFLNARV